MEKRLAKTEVAINRLARRSRKVATGLITPYPISNAVFRDDIQGTVLTYMFPCDGVISKGAVKLGEKPKGTVQINFELVGEIGTMAQGTTLNRIRNFITLNIKVLAGDCLKVDLTTTPDHPVNEIWISLLWKPSIKDVEAKSFLIDELDKAEVR